MGVFTTAARTWAAAEILTATNLNAQLRDFINGFGAWTAYTPTWTGATTNPAIGNGTITGAYMQVGKLVSYRINITAGSTTTYGSGAYYLFGLPVFNPGGGDSVEGMGVLLDSSTGGRYLAAAFLQSSTTIILLHQAAAGASTNVSPTSPVTMATGDKISIAGTYESA